MPILDGLKRRWHTPSLILNCFIVILWSMSLFQHAGDTPLWTLAFLAPAVIPPLWTSWNKAEILSGYPKSQEFLQYSSPFMCLSMYYIYVLEMNRFARSADLGWLDEAWEWVPAALALIIVFFTGYVTFLLLQDHREDVRVEIARNKPKLILLFLCLFYGITILLTLSIALHDQRVRADSSGQEALSIRDSDSDPRHRSSQGLYANPIGTRHFKPQSVATLPAGTTDQDVAQNSCNSVVTSIDQTMMAKGGEKHAGGEVRRGPFVVLFPFGELAPTIGEGGEGEPKASYPFAYLNDDCLKSLFESFQELVGGRPLTPDLSVGTLTVFVEILGHASERTRKPGSLSNAVVAQRRAEAVYDYLQRHTTDARRIQILPPENASDSGRFLYGRQVLQSAITKRVLSLKSRAYLCGERTLRSGKGPGADAGGQNACVDYHQSVEVVVRSSSDILNEIYVHLRYADESADLDFLEYFYFMIYTITTTGYGDIIPVTHFAKGITILANCIELFFIVVFFNALLASQRPAGRRSADPPPRRDPNEQPASPKPERHEASDTTRRMKTPRRAARREKWYAS